MRTIQIVKADLGAAMARADQIEAALKTDLAAASRRELSAELRDLETKTEALAIEIRDLERDERIKSIGRSDRPMRFDGTPYHGEDLAGALLEAGWSLKTQPRATVPIDTVLRLKAGSVSGGVDADTVHRDLVDPALGLDTRYLFPHVRAEGVDSGQTGVQSYRQASRTLATPTDMVRAIDATSTKPETATVSEVVTAELKQIASVSSGTPNVLLEHAPFRQWVNDDLAAAFRAAVDHHIVEEITAATIPTGGGGENVFEDILYSQEVVRAAGYNPTLVVVSPSDALAILLLQMEDGDHYVFTQERPTLIATSAVEDGAGFVLDPSALGTLHIAPFSLAAFEENSGKSNSSTVRGEANGLFVVQREAAAATLTSGS